VSVIPHLRPPLAESFGRRCNLLWRPGAEPAFLVEVARSFAAYVADLLDGARYEAHGS
jgi:sarcosine oxidase gamma subunit